MKFIKFIITISFCLLSFISCSEKINYRTVNIEIPMHPWEEYSKSCLWYTLKWTDGEEIKSKYINGNTRNLSIEIPLGETVCICAFPLGNMEPFGTAVTPAEDKAVYLLTQYEGRLARILMDQEAAARKKVNFPVLADTCKSVTDDFRCINEIELIASILNGNLNKSAIKRNSLTKIPELSVLNGIWISENEKDDIIQIHDTKMPERELPPGTHRFYCPSQNREIRITVDYNGTLSAVMKNSLVPVP